MALASEQPLEALSGRRFAFYPAIRNIEHNEWTIEQATWSEILAKNVFTAQEIWIPRSHLGKISSVDQPVLIVGLNRELEFKAGAIFPFRDRVVSMPGRPEPRSAASQAEPSPPPQAWAGGADSKTVSLIAKTVAGGVAVLLLASLFLFRDVRNPLEVLFGRGSPATDQRYLGLTAADGYHEVAGKIGPPERAEWITGEGAELQFQALWYPSRRYVVLLMGGERETARYIGTLHDPSRKVLDSAQLRGGGNASSLLRNLPPF
jgi:hypothetical protein